ncbi:Golgi Transport [Onygenales sp. PD_12]|nr:Golgi Transport [Onygenales sp. PD_12]KAK2802891.1 Golgi Transport [Onygenales sp. PD_10]
MGNILFLIGLPLILGPSKTLSFFARRQKLTGTITFALGILLILFRWPLIGFVVELYGVFVLFGDFLVTLSAFVAGVPVIGPPLKRALVFVGTAGGRSGGGSGQGELPV